MNAQAWLARGSIETETCLWNAQAMLARGSIEIETCLWNAQAMLARGSIEIETCLWNAQAMLARGSMAPALQNRTKRHFRTPKQWRGVRKSGLRAHALKSKPE